ncbi:PD-(D/E)XK nuclease superfamily protein [Vibrio owensii]|uniref:PD-(D/E)XK nuclease superfamily protein n=1 Tax=Vibrio owensii TaxID=696485 RepID=UPI00339209CA
MSRNQLLRDVESIIQGAGFECRHGSDSMTYQKNVSVEGLIEGGRDKFHFLLHTTKGDLPIVVRWQEVNGTALQKLGHTVLMAVNTEYNEFLVICGGRKLVMRAINYLNDHKKVAPKLNAIQDYELEDILLENYV